MKVKAARCFGMFQLFLPVDCYLICMWSVFTICRDKQWTTVPVAVLKDADTNNEDLDGRNTQNGTKKEEEENSIYHSTSSPSH